MLAYEKLDGWKVCHELAVATYRATEHGPSRGPCSVRQPAPVSMRCAAGARSTPRDCWTREGGASFRTRLHAGDHRYRILGEVPSELLHRLLPHLRVAEPDRHVRADVLEQQRQ